MNTQFWSVIAPISATFVGLIFIGISIYISTIRSAVGEVKAIMVAEEKSIRIMYISVLSNLVLFLLPVITSLTLINSTDTQLPFISGVSLLLLMIIFGGLIWGYENSKTHKQVDYILGKKNTRKLLRWRVKWLKYIIYLIVLLQTFLLIIYFNKFIYRTSIDECLGAITYFSIMLGLICVVIDLYLFDTNNVIFNVENSQIMVENLQQNLKVAMLEVTILYERYSDLIKRFFNDGKWDKIIIGPLASSIDDNPEDVKKKLCADFNMMKSKHDILQTKIPGGEKRVAIIEEALSKKNIFTLAEIQKFNEDKKSLQDEIRSFKELLIKRLNGVRYKDD